MHARISGSQLHYEPIVRVCTLHSIDLHRQCRSAHGTACDLASFVAAPPSEFRKPQIRNSEREAVAGLSVVAVPQIPDTYPFALQPPLTTPVPTQYTNALNGTTSASHAFAICLCDSSRRPSSCLTDGSGGAVLI